MTSSATVAGALPVLTAWPTPCSTLVTRAKIGRQATDGSGSEDPRRETRRHQGPLISRDHGRSRAQRRAARTSSVAPACDTNDSGRGARPPAPRRADRVPGPSALSDSSNLADPGVPHRRRPESWPQRPKRRLVATSTSRMISPGLRGSAHGTRGSAGPPAANSIKEVRHRDAAHLERMIGTAT